MRSPMATFWLAIRVTWQTDCLAETVETEWNHGEIKTKTHTNDGNEKRGRCISNGEEMEKTEKMRYYKNL